MCECKFLPFRLDIFSTDSFTVKAQAWRPYFCKRLDLFNRGRYLTTGRCHLKARRPKIKVIVKMCPLYPFHVIILYLCLILPLLFAVIEGMYRKLRMKIR